MVYFAKVREKIFAWFLCFTRGKNSGKEIKGKMLSLQAHLHFLQVISYFIAFLPQNILERVFTFGGRFCYTKLTAT